MTTMIQGKELRPGQFVCTNGQWRKVTRVEQLIDGNWSFSIDGYRTGWIYRGDCLFLISDDGLDELPDGSFKSEGTSVRAAIVVIQK